MADTKVIARVLLEMRYLANSPMTEGNTNQIVEAYTKDLSDIPEELLNAAAMQYRHNERFFPAAGALRQRAMELQLDAMRIPTATEAWGYVLSAPRYLQAVDCEEGYNLRIAINGLTNGEYMTAIHALNKHQENCKICSRGGYTEDYQHPAVKETVRLLGGRDVLLTDNPTADRARFIEAYREIVSRETKRAAMHPEVKQVVDDVRAGYLEDKKSAFDTGEQLVMRDMARLTSGMSK